MDIDLNKRFDAAVSTLQGVVSTPVQRRIVDAIADTLWYYSDAKNNWSLAEQLSRARAEFIQLDASAQRTGSDVDQARAVEALEHCEQIEHDLEVVDQLFGTFKSLYEEMPNPGTGFPETWVPRRDRRQRRPQPGAAATDKAYAARVEHYRNTKTAAGKAKAAQAAANGS